MGGKRAIDRAGDDGGGNKIRCFCVPCVSKRCTQFVRQPKKVLNAGRVYVLEPQYRGMIAVVVGVCMCLIGYCACIHTQCMYLDTIFQFKRHGKLYHGDRHKSIKYNLHNKIELVDY